MGADRRLRWRSGHRLDLGLRVSRRRSRWLRRSACREWPSLRRARGRSVRPHSQQLSARALEPRVGGVSATDDQEFRIPKWRRSRVRRCESVMGLWCRQCRVAKHGARRSRWRRCTRCCRDTTERTVGRVSERVECTTSRGAATRERWQHARNRRSCARVFSRLATAVARDDVRGLLPLRKRRGAHLRRIARQHRHHRRDLAQRAAQPHRERARRSALRNRRIIGDDDLAIARHNQRNQTTLRRRNLAVGWRHTYRFTLRRFSPSAAASVTLESTRSGRQLDRCRL